MPSPNLDVIFQPDSIAVVGASAQPGSVGHTVFSNLREGEFEGAVYPVNPNRESIDDAPCYADVGQLQNAPDLAIVCTPAEIVPEIVTQCGEAGIPGVIVISAGFSEAGDAGAEREQALLQAARKHPQMAILGPNCLGVMAPHFGLNASFATDDPRKGNLAFVSQSGALCTSVLDWSLPQQIGFSYFVSIGNMLDIGFSDLLDYFREDSRTDAVILYLESISQAADFLSAARRLSKDKPILAIKSGRYAESAQAAASHTGAMTGDDAVYDAAFRRAGIVRLKQVDDLFHCAELLSQQKTQQKIPAGNRLGIVTNAGGPGVLAADALVERHGVVAELRPETMDRLNAELPGAWSHSNPVDILGDASPQRFRTAADILLADDNMDGVLVVLSPQAMTDPTAAAEAIISVYRDSSKPLLAAWMGGGKVQEGIDRMNATGIPTYSSPEKAIRAFTYLVAYADRQRNLSPDPMETPEDSKIHRERGREVLEAAAGGTETVLSERSSRELLEAYEIPIAESRVAQTADEAGEFSSQLGFPVVLKINSPAISHKTDVGGVELNLKDKQAVRAAFDRICSQVREYQPEAELEGVTVQKMISASTSCELILGAKRHPAFGAVFLVGAGGTTAELYEDMALELPPLDESLARQALKSLKIWPLLNGYRNRKQLNVEQLVEVMIRLSCLIADNPEIATLDLNPLLVTPDKAIAVDARITLEQSEPAPPEANSPH